MPQSRPGRRAPRAATDPTQYASGISDFTVSRLAASTPLDDRCDREHGASVADAAQERHAGDGGDAQTHAQEPGRESQIEQEGQTGKKR